MPSPRGSELAQLISLWNTRHEQRATGGWWSLAGFSYQAAVFLARFFRTVEKDGVEPGELAQIERLSDIVSPTDGKLRLIQVKRTLDLRALRSFLEEAYLLTKLCREELPELLPHLVFQVGCRTRQTPQNPADLLIEDVIPGADASCWREMIAHLDESTPVLEEHDPLDALHLAFWNAGIRDSTSLLDVLLGRLLSSFLANSPAEMRELGRDLWNLYRTAERRPDWRMTGHALTPDLVRIDDDTTQAVLSGESPKLEHLRKGLFRARPGRLAAARAAFESWFARVEDHELTGRMPVFWIAGRSGEGKSVLLLQLLADLVGCDSSPVIMHAGRHEVEPLLALASRWPPPTGPSGPPIVAVDDIYDLYDRESWEQAIREACALSTPPLCLLTCGPTEQMEQFTSRLPDVFDVTPFELQRLTPAEFEEFVVWYENRSGKRRDPASLTHENPLLVQLLFELAQGERMPVFAASFKRRLTRLRVYDGARTIVAATALYVGAPVALLAETRLRDALERLKREDQLHFIVDETAAGGVRLAHPHLAWLLFREWVEPPETVGKALAREFHKVLEVRAADASDTAAFTRVSNALGATHLGLDDRREFLRELYRLHLAARDGAIDDRALPRWLELETKFSSLDLQPTALSLGMRALAHQGVAVVDGVVASAVWLRAEQTPGEAEQMQDVAKRFLFEHPAAPNVSLALGRILTQSVDRENAKRLVDDWLAVNATYAEAFRAIGQLVRTYPLDAPARLMVFRWLDANPQHPFVARMLATIVSANPQATEVRSRAVLWVAENISRADAYPLVVALAAHQGDPAMRSLALRWLDENPAALEAYQLLAPLLAANPANPAVSTRAARWFDANPSHPHYDWLLVPFIAANPTDPEVRRRAVNWLDANREHPRVHEVLRTLASGASSDPEVLSRIREWLDDYGSHKHAGQIIAALLASGSADARISAKASAWLEQNPSHPQCHEVIRTLVVASPSDVEVSQVVVNWLDRNREHPRAHEVVRVLASDASRDPEVLSRIRDWLDDYGSHPQADQIIASLVTAQPTAEVQSWVADWLLVHHAHPQIHQIIATLLAVFRSDPSITKHARAWLDANPHHPHEHVVLASWVSADPSDEAMRARAGQWLDDNPSHLQAPDMVRALVLANPSDADTRTGALAWLDGNPSHSHLHKVMIVLLATDSTDEGARTRATRWLGDNTEHPNAHRVLTTLLDVDMNDPEFLAHARMMLDREATPSPARTAILKFLITRAEDPAEWLARGLEYLGRKDAVDRDLMVVAMLSGTKAVPQYIDLALDYINNHTVGAKRVFLLVSLSRALVANPSACAAYLRSPLSAWQKRTVQKSVAHAIRDEDAAPAVACLRVLASEAPEHVAPIVEKVLRLERDSELLDEFLAEWLELRYRLPGYRRVLGAMSDRPVLKERLRARTDLTLRVRDELFPRAVATPPPRIPVRAAPAILPKPGQRVEVELLSERTKKDGWLARHHDSGLVGPIQNTAAVPPHHQPGDLVTLTVRMATERVIAFAY